MRPHQKITPGFCDKLCFTATATGSYEEAAQVASRWTQSSVNSSTIYKLVQRLGARAEAQTQERMKVPPQAAHPEWAASGLAILMVDGWMVRQRGSGWGKVKPRENRVEWHELKTGLFYRQEQAAQTQGGRGVLSDKVIVSWQGEPMELGRRLQWEALRGGLGRSRSVLFLGDGAPWIWNLQRDRWAEAIGLLDFYHASQHCWNLWRAVRGDKDPKLPDWMDRRLHWLRHGEQEKVLREIATLNKPAGETGEVIESEQAYFKCQAHRMNYQEIARRGWPIGSGAVESACRQKQCRFKRPGQFWTPRGLRHLLALDEARRNNHWNQLWN
ncbi:MAG TPA: hypothetical protein VKA67_04550 [Verrucomicrobiae bacterium]|nr:hypothetical protein [Verrucomicrobiae bacterium]